MCNHYRHDPDAIPTWREYIGAEPGEFSEVKIDIFPGRKGAVEPTDWHDIEERAFARTVAAAMEDMVRERKASTLIVVAPPKTLAEMRAAFHPDVKACIIAEITKGLTKHSVGEIEKHLMSEASI